MSEREKDALVVSVLVKLLYWKIVVWFVNKTNLYYIPPYFPKPLRVLNLERLSHSDPSPLRARVSERYGSWCACDSSSACLTQLLHAHAP